MGAFIKRCSSSHSYDCSEAYDFSEFTIVFLRKFWGKCSFVIEPLHSWVENSRKYHVLTIFLNLLLFSFWKIEKKMLISYWVSLILGRRTFENTIRLAIFLNLLFFSYCFLPKNKIERPGMRGGGNSEVFCLIEAPSFLAGEKS